MRLQKIIVLGMALFGCLWAIPSWGQGLGPKYYVKVTPTGNTLGITVRISDHPRISIYLTGNGRLSWFILNSGYAAVLLTPRGKVVPREIISGSLSKVVYDKAGHLIAFGKFEFKYTSTFQRIKSVIRGKKKYLVKYDISGRVVSFGPYKVTYNLQGDITKIGQEKMEYNDQKLLTRVGTLVLSYFDINNARLYQLGGVRLGYDRLNHKIVQVSGSDPNVGVHVLWYTEGRVYHLGK